ncbi:MAG: hypothetical protein COB98_04875 [Flavobacteriaceae bacterium]|nr:MAG: hypothetical protein COB98_04875 [Flavobacteriaceae bacterium]
MIFTGLKRKTLQSFLEKKRRENKGRHLGEANKKIKTVGLLLTDNIEGASVLKDLTKRFGFHKNQVTLLVYKPTLDVKKEANKEAMFGNADFGWYGAIKSPLVQQFIQTDFDLLINYSPSANLYIDTLVLLSKASFKVSHAGINDDFYDLVVATGLKDVATLNQEAKKYLQILNKL